MINGWRVGAVSQEGPGTSGLFSAVSLRAGSPTALTLQRKVLLLPLSGQDWVAQR